MTFKGSEIAVYKGGSDYTSVSEGGSPTGYFLRKYIQETTSFEADKEVSQQTPLDCLPLCGNIAYLRRIYGNGI